MEKQTGKNVEAMIQEIFSNADNPWLDLPDSLPNENLYWLKKKENYQSLTTLL